MHNAHKKWRIVWSSQNTNEIALDAYLDSANKSNTQQQKPMQIFCQRFENTFERLWGICTHHSVEIAIKHNSMGTREKLWKFCLAMRNISVLHQNLSSSLVRALLFRSYFLSRCSVLGKRWHICVCELWHQQHHCRCYSSQIAKRKIG